jgi:rubrerythrin
LNHELNKKLFSAIKKNDKESIEALIVEGADISAMNQSKECILEQAMHNCDLKIVRFLIEKGADVNFKGSYGYTALHIAVGKQNLKLVEYLIKNGADVNPPSTKADPILHVAVSKNNLKIVKFLIKYGADINALNNQREKAEYYAHRPDILFFGKHPDSDEYKKKSKELEKIAKYISSQDNNNVDKYRKMLRSKSAKKRILAKSRLGINRNSLILKCPECNALFHDNNPNLLAQWSMISGGSTIAGAVIVHCPSCYKEDSILKYYKSSSSLNANT